MSAVSTMTRWVSLAVLNLVGVTACSLAAPAAAQAGQDRPAVATPSENAGAATDPSASSTPAPVRIGGSIPPPRRTKNVTPVWPKGTEGGAGGVVVLDVTIGVTGTITDATVVRSVPPFEQAALDAVRGWEFTPTIVNGVPHAGPHVGHD